MSKEELEIELRTYKELYEHYKKICTEYEKQLDCNETCEYCEKNKLLKSCNFCGSATMKISESKEFNILEVQGDKIKFNLFKKIYCPRFDINYCPMCGRKLGGDKK